MNGLIWNCRGLNNALAPTIPKLRALISSTYYDFLFLIETKCNVNRVSPLFRSFGFVEATGVDANGAAGGLWVGWTKEARMSLIVACNNFMILSVEKLNGRLWYLVLFYGASKFELREKVFEGLEDYLQQLNHPFLIVGDFNQVEFGSDKLSTRNDYIRGACSFNNWKMRNELLDIPFKGPRFTWCNNRKGVHRIYERLDKALGSKEWFTLFPDTGIKHHPIQISDHAPIEIDLNLTTTKGKKPYKLDAWVLDYLECMQIIRRAWDLNDVGSPAFRVARKLARVRHHVKMWALDKRDCWSGKWDDFDKKLEHGIDLATSGEGEAAYELVNAEVREFAKAAATYWKQRATLKWMVDGDTCTKYFFN
ncbi:uncharacterized protein LOC141601616 [Silene latifolia]|uniref:uncharacterized protein LOC141601616 n=1 Tax=Silene latifolia TaxID=37657 RepID=UPI003D771F2F